MKTIPLLLLIILLTAPATAQQITVSSGTLFLANEVVIRGDLTINGALDATAASFLFSGDPGEPRQFTPGANATVQDLWINTPLLTLMGDLAVTNEVFTEEGDVDLNGFDIDLGTTGFLSEGGGQTVRGTSGTIRAERTYATAISRENIAGLGFEITALQALGLVTVVRGHAPQTGGISGIQRYWDVTADNHTGLGDTLRLHYDESELNTLAEADLLALQSADAGASWNQVSSTVMPAVDVVIVNDADQVGRWTLGTELAVFLELAGRALLEGPYAGNDTMYTVLSDVLPETDPYFGTASVPSGFFATDANGKNVVDWVWLQLRSGDPTGTMTIEAETAALLTRFGTLTGTDAITDISFSGTAPGQYYLVVGHRNHLAVMSAQPIDCTSGSCTYDFRGSQSLAYGTNAMKDLTAAARSRSSRGMATPPGASPEPTRDSGSLQRLCGLLRQWRKP